MNFELLITEYLCYLMNRVGLEAEGEEGYLRLCETLQEIEFLPQTTMDENRCSECAGLREDFAESYEIPDDVNRVVVTTILREAFGDNGTMMELLIVLAERMRYEMLDSQFEASTRKWFLELLLNCGLEKNILNSHFENEGNEEVVKDTMNRVIFRKTGWDGEGGLFPLAYPQYDQRRVELIIQMNNYLAENYDI